MSMDNVQEFSEHPDFEIQTTEARLLHASEYGKCNLLYNLLKSYEHNEEFNIDTTKNSLWTPLFMAAKQGHADCVKLLLEAGAEVDGINKHKAAWTPLWVATYAGHEKCVKLLLDKGAKLEVKYPETPLVVAAREGQLECLKLLIKAGANLSVKYHDGRVPIHIAVMNDFPEIARELVEAGCQVNIEDDFECTPLLLSCFHANEEMLEILLKAGADHSKRFYSLACVGYTALHICASTSKRACIEKLWEYGADFNARTSSGSQAQEITPDDSCRKLITQLQGTVRSLKEICRLKIRQLLPICQIDEVGNIYGLPQELISYLKYEH
ncbi:ankyrin repeat, PH and SEC7 domain containing protein secG-like [Rhopilema esculentum]|uniref:ankyrin repeat, PH and SEC7 domain containing protein secG-like n=1 Tax=Rhopilema esculentum TaxID=499914 RepID=UPI0031DD725B